ncbi:MAG: hypothetical protein Satyrvirus22_21 [Satyrvirus sp.]|uniref:Uncharacterized protein n=1 Tax=Satyrvirus sp. TaxID=2487771 RepID=A0A3G5AEG0_9VIRU|nr:MAG: hypothetical protein Satyrvirus22_21 [Satyrvirus sp.]
MHEKMELEISFKIKFFIWKTFENSKILNIFLGN